ncbi:MAG: dolichyl-phosphate beta-glucosyltransferase [bacterium]
MVIPAYNEESRIGQSVARIRDYLASNGYTFEIIVVNDGSNDRTSEIVSNIQKDDDRISLLSLKENMGKGYAVRVGMLAARGDVILFSDADLSTPIEEIENLLNYLGEFDLVIGSRSLPDSRLIVRQPHYREMMGRIFNFLVRCLLVRGFVDTQCGFKIMTRATARAIFRLARINSFSFDVEMIFIANKHHFKIRDVPVTWINSRNSKVHPLIDSAKMLLDLFRIKLYHAIGYYNTIERE